MTNSKSQKTNFRKPVFFIASGQPAKERRCGKNTPNAAYGRKRITVGSQVGHVLTDDSDDNEMNQDNTEKYGEDSTTRKRIVGGANKNKRVAALKADEKLDIQFFNNRAAVPNQQYWSRHLGKIMRNKFARPIRVLKWKEMTNSDKKLMWDIAKDKFYNPSKEVYREHTSEHKDTLWTAWRSNMNKKYMKPCKTKSLALKNVPPSTNGNDWEWLVTNKFVTNKFQDTSSRNANNRAKGVMPHRSGSQPHRQIIHEMRGKKDIQKDIGAIFFATRQKKESLLNQEMKKNMMKWSRLFKEMNHSHLLYLLTLALVHKTTTKSLILEVR